MGGFALTKFFQFVGGMRGILYVKIEAHKLSKWKRILFVVLLKRHDILMCEWHTEIMKVKMSRLVACRKTSKISLFGKFVFALREILSL